MASILPGRKREKPANIRAELSKLRQACEAVVAEIEAAERELATCEDEKRIVPLLAKEKAARNRLRTIEADIADAVERLGVAEAAEREQQRRALLSRYGEAVKAFAAKTDGVIIAIGEVMDALDAIGDAGFSSEFQMMPRPPVVGEGAMARGVLVRRDIVDSFVQNVTAAITPAKRPVAVVPIAPVQPASASPAQPSPSGTQVVGGFFAGRPDEPPAPPRRAPLREAAKPGEQLFMLHRGRLDLPRKGPLQSGDVVSLRPDEGAPLVIKGAGDWTTAEEVAAIDASLGEAGAPAEDVQPLSTAPEGAAEAPAADAELAQERAA